MLRTSLRTSVVSSAGAVLAFLSSNAQDFIEDTMRRNINDCAQKIPEQ